MPAITWERDNAEVSIAFAFEELPFGEGNESRLIAFFEKLELDTEYLT